MELIGNIQRRERRDTAANWASSNPTPLAGEWCQETDTLKGKWGDGVTAYNSLTYSIIPDVESLEITRLHIQDQKTSGTSGGDFTSGAWQTRDLNTVLTNTITGASLSSNQIILPSGVFKIQSFSTAFDVGSHKARLRNITDSLTDIVGSSEQTSTDDAVQTRSMINGVVTISSETVFEVQHYCDTTRASSGFGLQCGFSELEVYTDIFIEKIG